MNDGTDNEPPQEPLHTWIEPELEARLTALVLGEASDFECEELEREIEVRPELGAYRKRLEAMHSLLSEVGKGKATENDEEWKLSGERRAMLLERIGGSTSGEAPIENTQPHAARAGEAPKRNWVAPFLKIAASLMVATGLALFGFFQLAENEHVASSSYGRPGGEAEGKNTIGYGDFSIDAGETTTFLSSADGKARSERVGREMKAAAQLALIDSEDEPQVAAARSSRVKPLATTVTGPSPVEPTERNANALGIDRNGDDLFAATVFENSIAVTDGAMINASGAEGGTVLMGEPTAQASVGSLNGTVALGAGGEILLEQVGEAKMAIRNPQAPTAESKPVDLAKRESFALVGHGGRSSAGNVSGEIVVKSNGDHVLEPDGERGGRVRVGGGFRGNDSSTPDEGRLANGRSDQVTFQSGNGGAMIEGEEVITREGAAPSGDRHADYAQNGHGGTSAQFFRADSGGGGGGAIFVDAGVAGEAAIGETIEPGSSLSRQESLVRNEPGPSLKSELEVKNKVPEFEKAPVLGVAFANDFEANQRLSETSGSESDSMRRPGLNGVANQLSYFGYTTAGTLEAVEESIVGEVGGKGLRDQDGVEPRNYSPAEGGAKDGLSVEQFNRLDADPYRTSARRGLEEAANGPETLPNDKTPKLNPNVHAGGAAWGVPMAGGDVDRDLARDNEAQHEWQTYPGQAGPGEKKSDAIQWSEGQASFGAYAGGNIVVGDQLRTSGEGSVDLIAGWAEEVGDAMQDILALTPQVVGGGAMGAKPAEGEEGTEPASDLRDRRFAGVGHGGAGFGRVFGSGGMVEISGLGTQSMRGRVSKSENGSGVVLFDPASDGTTPESEPEGETTEPVDSRTVQVGSRFGNTVIEGADIQVNAGGAIVLQSGGRNQGQTVIGGEIEAPVDELKAHGNVYALAIDNSGAIRATGSQTDHFSIDLNGTPEVTEFEGFVNYGRPIAAESAGKKLRFTLPAGLDETAAADEAFSTFSLHVSDVSFQLAQAALAKGEWPDRERIRIEEFVNAFDYGDPMPGQSDKVACRVEQAAHPFFQQRNLLQVSMRTAEAGRSASTPLRLTFLLDNSGSMERADRQETVKRAFATLASQLQPSDQVSLISFARQPRLVADAVSGEEAGKLVETVATLPAEGGTNLEAALQVAFEKAKEHQLDGAQNRIVLLTDGAANLGDAEPENLSRMIESMRESGIAFDAAGIGADGLNDEILEALTRKGDGRYYFLDRPEDAEDGFAKQISGALRPAAKNVKVQVEFNPDRVGRYKLLGFEKHRLEKEDFRNDAVDAAEMAAAEAGVAVYQVEPMPEGEGNLGSVSVRFRDLDTGEMVEKRWPIPYLPSAPAPDQAADSMRLATVAAQFAAKLKGGPLGDMVDLGELARLAASLPERDQRSERVRQLREMIEQARSLEGGRQ